VLTKTKSGDSHFIFMVHLTRALILDRYSLGSPLEPEGAQC